MQDWIIFVIVLYFIGALIFGLAIVFEAPKHQVKPTGIHFIVALIWFIWLPWYLISIFRERSRSGNRI